MENFRKSNFFHKSKYLHTLLRFSFVFAAVERNLVPSNAISPVLIFLGAGKIKKPIFRQRACNREIMH